MNSLSWPIFLNSYLFLKAKYFFHPKIYHGIYQYDGKVVFIGIKISRDKILVKQVSEKMNKAARNGHIQFTAEIWTNDRSLPPLKNRTSLKKNQPNNYSSLI